jgi:anti-sigma regulatory factor (Ser/Thr protein kinase)
MHTITLPAHLTSLVACLAFVADCAAAVGFPPARIAEIELAVEEAMANICQYAYPDSAGAIEIRCRRSETQEFLIELIDAGAPFDILARPAPTLTAEVDQRQIGGLGIHLILALMDHVVYQREGMQNVLQLAVRLPQ